MSKEEINNMKLCTLCLANEYTEEDAKLHEMFGLHKTGSRSWSPLKGHLMYPRHEFSIKMFNLKK